VRNTVKLVRAAEGRPLESTRETTTAGYVLPSDGSLGGIIVTRRPVACDGTFDVAATEYWIAASTRRTDNPRTRTALFPIN
jgi:hypothetical protein